MDNNWIVENLTNAFGVWNSKMTEMWSLLTESPQTFKGGTIWQTIVTINGGMQAIGYGLLVLFFAIGIFRSASGFRDFQRPEHLLRHFIYFVLAKLGITYGMDLLVDVFDVCSGIVATAAGSVGGLTGASVALPQEIADAIGDVGFLASMWYDLTLFDVEGDFFGKLEQGYSILSVSDLFHCTAWNATEYLADEQNRDKENSCWKGMQRYLNYCKKHGITRNYLVKKEEYDGIDAMKFYDKSAVAKFEKNRKTQDRCR